MHQRLSSYPGTTDALTITRDGLPLILLAAVHHPDADVRYRLGRRIEALVAARRPFASAAEVRRLFTRSRDSPARRLNLDPCALDLAVPVVRLVFARATNLVRRHRLLLVGPDEADPGVTLAYAPFRVEPLEMSWGGRNKRHRFQVRLDTGDALVRMAMFRFRPPPCRAFCLQENGFVLEVVGPSGWNFTHRAGSPIDDASTGSGQPLRALGLVGEWADGGVRITTPTAESIIRFSACLARGEMLRIKLGPRSPAETHLFIRLRDFDDAWTELSVAVFPGDPGDDWLIGLPPLEMHLPLDEVLPVIHWAFPRDEWLVPELRERLVTQPCV